jgi:TolB-like protein/Flp pilus assembly protein TadD
VELAQVSPATEQTKPVALSNEQKIDKKSIAVMPFRNRSADEENAEFFSDGVHDELLTNLSRIEKLKVISRTSVTSYRDTTKNIKQIGEELGVANILEGGVQRAGDTVRINVQLIDAATDEHLWAKVYDRKLTVENLFAIQTEIAQEIANALEAKLSSREREQLATVPTTNLEAYDNLLLARQLIERGNWKSLREAQPYLRKTIEHDGGFVEAYVLLARSYYNLFSTGATSLQAIDAAWIQTIQTALSLDKNNATAYATLAQYQWKKGLEGAEQNFEKARQLEPGNADILSMYADYLRKTFHPDRALPLYRMARELDPLSVPILYGLARIHETRRELDKSLKIYEKIRQIDPTSQIGIGPVTTAHMFSGDMAQAIEWLFKALLVDPEDSDLANWIAVSYIDFGAMVKARQWLTWIEKTKNINPMTFAGMAMLNIYEGDIEASFPYTRQALDNIMPNRWGSDAALVRALLIWAMDQDQTDTALSLLKLSHPGFFEQNPPLNADNVLQAIDTAHLLQEENQNDKANALLQAVLAAYQIPYTITEVQHATGKAQALALLGEKQAALKELRRQMEQGWRFLWRWNTELNPNFKMLHNDPEFREIVEFLRSDMARQYQGLRKLEATGKVWSPPGAEAR